LRVVAVEIGIERKIRIIRHAADQRRRFVQRIGDQRRSPPRIGPAPHNCGCCGCEVPQLRFCVYSAADALPCALQMMQRAFDAGATVFEQCANHTSNRADVSRAAKLALREIDELVFLRDIAPNRIGYGHQENDADRIDLRARTEMVQPGHSSPPPCNYPPAYRAGRLKNV
jgi:hypothetical protein